ncbi:MFS transporter [Croceicoccus naphthovorans]|uniref:Membrane protein n=1 Tax=Croceicoccus naphthovorans TaxID=1348774 RepID=A0A0G3XJ18_9SPHN|nr:MFS transporter [Croceicoccus naphthovorans]AKM10373.1 membrane protein [Croceicoccus naphthovorans]MBB3990067.1 MFS family permease [Croceicoccus naphthovorans]
MNALGQAGGDARQSARFLLLYALGWAGCSIAYVPFLTVLLPLRVTDMAGAGDVRVLGYLTFGGAIAASLANIAFGWLSDRTGYRRAWVAAGLAGNCALLLMVPLAQGAGQLLALLLVWQVMLNMMMGPLSAWAGDCVPDGQKGLLGGLMAFAPAAGAVTSAVVTIPGLAGPEGRLWIVATVVAVCVLPVLLFGRPRPFPELMRDDLRGPAEAADPAKPVKRMWAARLLVQVAEAALFAYLLYWFRSIDSAVTDAEVARIFGFVLAAAVPLALLSGRWADRAGRPIVPLAICAAIAALGLVTMALAQGMALALSGYVVFGLSSTVFLALHSSQTLRVLPRARHRGRDLGIFNLTNTVPSLFMPWLTIAVVPAFGYSGLMAILAVLAVIACLLLISTARTLSRKG